ncbi:hypothetical protein NEOLEDRAFT_1058633 [Neolentinus lepideus HHB14362 ss-1]|uniref:DUF4219 domain-containing protein n=1 Tax=Neolentinus lepideus HHB14362 ss-1 TaxID=1314782 RepID=A0A165URF0_9AGAM|nr:hypothetical protein NEOLEDRAFT_1058633 [Neolentinus lepideus HHB14362 ss-1]
MTTLVDQDQLWQWHIEPLRGDNYNTWSVRMTDILTISGLWDYVQGIVQPDTLAGATASPKVSAMSEAVTVPLATWCHNNQLALNAIRLRTSFAISDTLAVITARRRFYRAECAEGADIDAHIRQMREYQAEIHRYSARLIDDEEFSLTLLTSLPESWDTFIQSLDNVSTLGSHKLVARILDEWRSRCILRTVRREQEIRM